MSYCMSQVCAVNYYVYIISSIAESSTVIRDYHITNIKTNTYK